VFNGKREKGDRRREGEKMRKGESRKDYRI